MKRTVYHAAVLAAVILLSAMNAIHDEPSLVKRAAFEAERVMRRHERLHFGIHLAAGRTLGVAPWTRDAADTQYAKALAHAHTSRQRALVTADRPRTPVAALKDSLRVSG
ncbi:MAG: hypothetical protein U0531_02985 [Dehalococcoidia bacterium]